MHYNAYSWLFHINDVIDSFITTMLRSGCHASVGPQ